MSFLSLLVEELKKQGLEVTEEAAKDVVNGVFAAAKAAAAATPGTLDDALVETASLAKGLVLDLADKINPHDNV